MSSYLYYIMKLCYTSVTLHYSFFVYTAFDVHSPFTTHGAALQRMYTNTQPMFCDSLSEFWGLHGFVCNNSALDDNIDYFDSTGLQNLNLETLFHKRHEGIRSQTKKL